MGEPKRVTQKRASGFLSLPSTSIGKWSARLLLLSLVLILLNTFVVMPATEQRTGLELAQAVFNFLLLLPVVSAGSSGLFALLMKRERSWVVVVAVLLFILVVAANLSQYVIPA